MEEKYILVSLEEEKSKQLATVLSNDTSRRILDYLAEKEMSETDIAKKLNLPISTVHYNVQNLLKSDLVEIKDFVYSEKGNKINIYKISRKMIIIAPKGIEIKSILPVAAISLAASAVIYFFYNEPAEIIAKETAIYALDKAAVAESAPIQAMQVINQAPYYAFWFLAGSISAILLYALINYIRKKLKK